MAWLETITASSDRFLIEIKITKAWKLALTRVYTTYFACDMESAFAGHKSLIGEQLHNVINCPSQSMYGVLTFIDWGGKSKERS